MLLYAADTVLFAESAKELQEQLNCFESYCKAWKLKVTVSKTRVMVFSRKSRPAPNLVYNSEPIDVVQCLECLGCILSRNGTFASNIKDNVTQATKTMHGVLRKCRSNSLSISCQIDMFDEIVKTLVIICF